MRYFLSGGSKSGKSLLAQTLARDMGAPRYYLATMIPVDEEDRRRIRRHLMERDGWGFETVECGGDLPAAVRDCDPDGSFLLDSVTAWLSNLMFPRGGGMDPDAPARAEAELEWLCNRCGKLVIVSDEVYSDAVRYAPWTEAYRAGLARVCRRAVALCDVALEVTAGIPVVHKGAWK